MFVTSNDHGTQYSISPVRVIQVIHFVKKPPAAATEFRLVLALLACCSEPPIVCRARCKCADHEGSSRRANVWWRWGVPLSHEPPPTQPVDSSCLSLLLCPPSPHWIKAYRLHAPAARAQKIGGTGAHPAHRDFRLNSTFAASVYRLAAASNSFCSAASSCSWGR